MTNSTQDKKFKFPNGYSEWGPREGKEMHILMLMWRDRCGYVFSLAAALMVYLETENVWWAILTSTLAVPLFVFIVAHEDYL